MKKCLLIVCAILLSACQFHLQGTATLAPPLHRMYLQTSEPYGYLTTDLKQYLIMSNVTLVDSAKQANTVLVILQDSDSQVLLSVSGTQQTRQYNLITTVLFEITDPEGRILVAPQKLTESRAITIQSNQILGSSNEASLFYQQMRRSLAYAIMNRLASRDITQLLMNKTR